MQQITPPIRIVGSHGSPYTRKMLALMRYRRVPHLFLRGDARNPPAGLPRTKVPLLPTLYFPGPDGSVEAATDSTVLIRRLEAGFPDRSVIPADPLLAFVDYLIEDFADEWLTRAMFHYRWHFAADARHAALLIPLWIDHGMPAAMLDAISREFSARQIGRLGVVGSSPATAPLIEASYLRVLTALENLLTGSDFLFGRRPSAADFALYGQLAQLAGVDPTPAALAAANAPRVCAWTDVIEDLSGLESTTPEDWSARAEALARVAPLVAEMGRTWLPCMLANAAALAAGESRFRALVDGQPWEQQSFPYQGKCLRWIAETWQALEPAVQAEAAVFLREHGCAALLESGALS